jgi:hypothetical protein
MYGLNYKMQYAKDECNLYEMNSYEWELSKIHISEILTRNFFLKHTHTHKHT